jgi:CheY-like chemotaxis protein
MQQILVVDDEDSVRDSLALALGRGGFSIETACDAEEALEKFHAHRYPLVLTDMRMSGMSGADLARALKLICPEQKVILVTAFRPANGMEMFDEVIQKPFWVDDLLRKVNAVLARPDGGDCAASPRSPAPSLRATKFSL